MKLLSDFLPKKLSDSNVEKIYNFLYDKIPLAGNLNQDPCNLPNAYYIEGGHFNSKTKGLEQIYTVKVENVALTLQIFVSFQDGNYEAIKKSKKFNKRFPYSTSLNDIEKWIIMQIKQNEYFSNFENEK
jgi:hypothetical protein